MGVLAPSPGDHPCFDGFKAVELPLVSSVQKPWVVVVDNYNNYRDWVVDNYNNYREYSKTNIYWGDHPFLDLFTLWL